MSLILRTDVTAVKFYKNFVLAGIGSFVCVFHKETTKLLQRIHTLNGQKIYGLVPSSCGLKILVFGGKQFTVLSTEPLETQSDDLAFARLFVPVVCDDWLHSGVWINENLLALLSAHNLVQKWDIKKQVIQAQHQSKDNSILYSGLLLPLHDDLLVFAGTVFSEVIIHQCCDEKPLHYLRGHRGVIFSISCDSKKGIIATTSDDRSVRIWALNNIMNLPYSDKEYWKQVEITCQHEIYGHSARVMRSCITDQYIVSVGEDSAICFWNYNGRLLRKIVSHQNSSIWSIDSDTNHLVTGGGDCGVILHPLTVASEYGQHELLDIKVGTPKKIMFTARRNIVILNENELIYNDITSKSKMVYNLNHESTYKLLSISSCKQMIAVADMCGKLDVFVENCKDTPCLQNIVNTNLLIDKVLSMQWASNRHLVLCSANGAVTVLASKGNATEVYATFAVPPCKERWLTAAAISFTMKILVLGDRSGNVHIYIVGQREPIKTLIKVHGRYGPTSIMVTNNEIVTTGRDGTIKYFSFNTEVSLIKFMNSKELEFQWVEKFLDNNKNMICGFRERVFVVYDVNTNSKLLEVPCGGGHRSWDAIRCIDKVNDGYAEFIQLVFIKNAEVHIDKFQMNKIVPQNIVNGSHSKEINCLKTYKTILDRDVTFYVSGGEDTTLRISSITADLQFQDEVVFKQLSSVRTLRLFPLNNDRILLLSAGGRAQICIKIINFEKVNIGIKLTPQDVMDYLIKGTDKERKGNQTWRNCSIDFDPETRIMDLDIVKSDNQDFIIFAGCSDACIRIFKFSLDVNVLFRPLKELRYHRTCILKINCINLLDTDTLVACTTRGEISFWNVIDINNLESCAIKPFFNTRTNASGINSFASRILSDSSVLIATGGDDNSVHLIMIGVSDKNNLESLKVFHKWSTDQLHCSQITGVVLLDDFLISTSIDQRITLCRWKIAEAGIQCDFVTQTYSDVADIQGMDVLSSSSDEITVCVFGKGFEVIAISKSGGT